MAELMSLLCGSSFFRRTVGAKELHFSGGFVCGMDPGVGLVGVATEYCGGYAVQRFPSESPTHWRRTQLSGS